MKLTKTLVRAFEQEQQRSGTTTALFNLLWLKAADDLKQLGVTKVTTRTRPTARKQAA